MYSTDGFGTVNQSDIALRWLQSVEEDIGRELTTIDSPQGEKVYIPQSHTFKFHNLENSHQQSYILVGWI